MCWCESISWAETLGDVSPVSGVFSETEDQLRSEIEGLEHAESFKTRQMIRWMRTGNIDLPKNIRSHQLWASLLIATQYCAISFELGKAQGSL